MCITNLCDNQYVIGIMYTVQTYLLGCGLVQDSALWPLLLTWFNFNPSKDK